MAKETVIKIKGASKIKVSKSYRTFQIINTIIMILISAATLYPFVYMVAQSFSSERAIVSKLVKLWPVDFNLTTYAKILSKGDFLGYYKNTVIIAIIGTIASLFATAMMAYPLSKPHLRLNKFIAPFVIFTMYFGGGMIPMFILINRLNIDDTFAALIFPGLINTYYVILMRSFFASVSKDLEEAGEIDGLSKFGVFFKIVLPLSKPIVATMLLFYAVGYWNNWFNTFLYINKKELWPVAYYLRTIITGASTAADPGAVNAESMQIATNIKSCCMVLMSAPIICVYPFVQRFFVQGMMLGGVKE